MPHLDEGALWVRATMPYTISFEEDERLFRSKGPRCVDDLSASDDHLLRSWAVPTMAPDPTGFFNCEFYMGLKPL